MFLKVLEQYRPEDVAARIREATGADLHRALSAQHIRPEHLYAMLSPAAETAVDELSVRASSLTRMRFGNTIQLYAPLYISNECANSCLYCGFSVRNKIRRVTLTMKERVTEAEAISAMGFRHILLLTGEKPGVMPPEEIAATISEMKKIFPSVSIEVYPMDVTGYTATVNAGADGLTIYQETYDREAYARFHPAGEKSRFEWRLASPERGGEAGFRRIGIGALLGLSDWRVDSFYTALHALYLAKKYWRSQINISFPRITRAEGGFVPEHSPSDNELTALIAAMRLILPDSGLTLSTREPAPLRDKLIPLGITMMSAGSKTDPGGYGGDSHADSQFSVQDERTPEEISAVLKARGFDPVWKDWDSGFLSA
jgi:2-iminoacetate synthase